MLLISALKNSKRGSFKFKNILYRVLLTSHKYYIIISVNVYYFNEDICDTTYFKKCKRQILQEVHNTENKGLKDTVLFLLQSDCHRSRILLNNFLSPF